jgi:hypothetical protein
LSCVDRVERKDERSWSVVMAIDSTSR